MLAQLCLLRLPLHRDHQGTRRRAAGTVGNGGWVLRAAGRSPASAPTLGFTLVMPPCWRKLQFPQMWERPA